MCAIVFTFNHCLRATLLKSEYTSYINSTDGRLKELQYLSFHRTRNF